MYIYIHTHTCCAHGEGGERERVHERETDMRKPLTALPASHRAAPPCITPKTTARRRQQRCCGSTGQPTKKPACLMAASTLDRCNKMPTPTTTVPLAPNRAALLASVLHLNAHLDPPTPPHCVYLYCMRQQLGKPSESMRSLGRHVMCWPLLIKTNMPGQSPPASYPT